MPAIGMKTPLEEKGLTAMTEREARAIEAEIADDSA